MTCKDCLHNEACVDMLQAMGFTVDGDGYLADKRCRIFKDKNNYAEVVRCKECKHWGIQENCTPGFKYFCNANALYAWGSPVRNQDDFCSYGERKDNV